MSKKVYLGEQLKEFLNENFFTLSMLIEKIGVSPPSFYDILNGKTKHPRVNNLLRLEEELNHGLKRFNKRAVLGKDSIGIYFEVDEIKKSLSDSGNDEAIERMITHILGESNLNKEKVEDIKKIVKLLPTANARKMNLILTLIEELKE